jgi:hypothetical protein
MGRDIAERFRKMDMFKWNPILSIDSRRPNSMEELLSLASG